MDGTPAGRAKRDLDRGGSRPRRSRRAAWIRRAGLLALSIACARIIIGLVGSIDWAAVWAGIEHLQAWQFAVLIAVVVPRQILNAKPLVFFTDRLSVLGATGIDQGCTLLAWIAPPTTDTVFRILVLRSWGIEVDKAAAASTCKILVFEITRWLSPLFGVLLLASVRFDAGYGVTAGLGLLIAVGTTAAALLTTKSRPLALRLGRRAGRIAARVRKSVDPGRWASSVADFQGHMASRMRRGLALSIPVLTGMLLLDAGMVLLAVRFVGIDQSQLSWVEVVAGFLVAFPLTMFPLGGLGLLDATIVAELTSVGGVELEAALVAALVTYRVVSLGVPGLLGALFIASWRHLQRQAGPTQRDE